MLISVPFVLLLLDFWPLRRLRTFPTTQPGLPAISFSRAVVEKIPLFVLSVASAIATLLAAHGSEGALDTVPLIDRLDTERGGSHQKLRQVGTGQIAGRESPEQSCGGNLPVHLGTATRRDTL